MRGLPQKPVRSASFPDIFIRFLTEIMNISILNVNTANKNSFLGAVIITGSFEKGAPGEGTVSLVGYMLQ